MSTAAQNIDTLSPELQELQSLEFSLAKQVPLGSDTLLINSPYGGELELSGDLGRKAVKAIRLVMMHEAFRIQTHVKKGGVA